MWRMLYFRGSIPNATGGRKLKDKNLTFNLVLFYYSRDIS